MNLPLLLRTVGRKLQQDGLRETFAKAIEHLRGASRPDEFDRKYGTQTAGVEPLWRLKIDSQNAEFGARYEATTQQDLINALESIPEDLSQFTFIDLGCGKGRTLLIAGELGFSRIIGVEFAAELVEIARQNLEKLSIANAVVHHMDAAEFWLPAGNVIVYLYNPFSEAVMRKVIGNLGATRTGKLYVVYKGLQCAGLFDSCTFLERIGHPPKSSNICVWSTVS